MMCAAAAAAGAGGSGIPSSSSHAMGLGVRVIPGAGRDVLWMGSGMGSCAAVGARSDCRSRYQLLLSGRALAERYRRIYTAAVSDREQGLGLGRGKKALSKKKLKRRQKVKSKVKTRTKVSMATASSISCSVSLRLRRLPRSENRQRPRSPVLDTVYCLPVPRSVPDCVGISFPGTLFSPWTRAERESDALERETGVITCCRPSLLLLRSDGWS